MCNDFMNQFMAFEQAKKQIRCNWAPCGAFGCCAGPEGCVEVVGSQSWREAMERALKEQSLQSKEGVGDDNAHRV